MFVLDVEIDQDAPLRGRTNKLCGDLINYRHRSHLEALHDDEAAVRVYQMESCEKVKAAVGHLLFAQLVRGKSLKNVRVSALKLEDLRIRGAHTVLHRMEHLVVGVVHDEDCPDVWSQGFWGLERRGHPDLSAEHGFRL